MPDIDHDADGTELTPSYAAAGSRTVAAILLAVLVGATIVWLAASHVLARESGCGEPGSAVMALART